MEETFEPTEEVSTVTTIENRQEDDEEEDTMMVEAIKNYVKMDNAKKQLVKETKDLSAPMKVLQENITKYMTKKMIIKIPTNRPDLNI